PNLNSPTDINKFRLWINLTGKRLEESEKEWKKETKGSENEAKQVEPSYRDIKKYILWVSQKCISPYSGKIIPLSKLFTDEYEIEHIIPRSRLKDDSLANLVICESGINKAKGNELAAVFIKNSNGRCKYGDTEYSLLSYDGYVEHVKKTFKGKKLKNLLATEVPDDFVARQLNDTRHIARKCAELLKPVVGKEQNIL
ncbi:MAG: hypothetical protein NC925_05980, partial [Candidatus Omnitrophica bacterium]|nr:hypothetical protein [Candidatus Omnitrophota bacterium]